MATSAGAIHALGLVKYAAALANRDLGKLTGTGKNPLNAAQVDALLAACREVAAGQFDDQFPIDVFQTGSGTSSNMNVNEVIANRAIEPSAATDSRLEKADPSQRSRQYGPKHQRHVSDGHPRRRRQRRSTTNLMPALGRLRTKRSADKARSGTRSSRSAARTWPTPRRFAWVRNSADTLGKSSCQSIARGWRSGPCSSCRRRHRGRHRHQHPSSEFGAKVAAVLAGETGVAFVEAENHFEANASRDGLVECSGELRAIAVSLFRSPTTFAGSAAGLAAGSTKSCFQTVSPARRSCRAR